MKNNTSFYIKLFIFLIFLVVVITCFFYVSYFKRKESLILSPKIKDKANGKKFSIAKVQTEVGTGYSIKEDPKRAILEAIAMALQNKQNKIPDFAIIFASGGSDLQSILITAKRYFHNKTKIYGGTSDSRGVMTDKGFIKVTGKGYEQAAKEGKRAVTIMTITSKEMVFGVGSADFSAFPSIQEASRQALCNAIKSARKTLKNMPQVILTTPTLGTEEEAIAGIEDILGKKAIILGGTAGGPEMGVIGAKKVYQQGISLAVLYTDLPLGWTFEAGFEVTAPQTGIVTKVHGQAIVEIDHRPALDVYNEWLGGEIDRLHKKLGEPDLVKDLLTLRPLYRKYTSNVGQNYLLFSHPWPKDPNLKGKEIMTSTKIKEKERVYLSHGRWEILMNRIGNLPKNAKLQSSLGITQEPILGIGYICAGVLGTIPENEREKLGVLINYANAKAPYISCFTWGEQGPFPGIGNKHGNLTTSFLVIGKKNKK